MTPLVPERTECRSCHKPVFWAYSGIGKPMMVNFDPDEEMGNLDISLVDGRIVFEVVDPESVALPGMAVPRYTSHFATCVHAKLWRKDTRGRLQPPAIG